MNGYSANDLYDMFANQAPAEAIANTSLDGLASDIIELIGNEDSPRYPHDIDGTIDAYAIARMVRDIARENTEVV